VAKSKGEGWGDPMLYVRPAENGFTVKVGRRRFVADSPQAVAKLVEAHCSAYVRGTSAEEVVSEVDTPSASALLAGVVPANGNGVTAEQPEGVEPETPAEDDGAFTDD